MENMTLLCMTIVVFIIRGTYCDCDIGKFGDECSRSCHCADEKPCDRVTGECQLPICIIGYIGVSCDEVCPPYYFGEKCLERCFCADHKDCTKDYGICQSGCSPGYEGAHCDKACPSGKYGSECSEICGNCFDLQACNHVTGYCENGCGKGYTGQLCKKVANLLDIARPIFTMSSIYKNWAAERIIDGKDELDPVECQCCSSTLNEAKSWLKIKMDQLYAIKYIIIYGRKDEQDYDHLQGFTLLLKNHTSTQNSSIYYNNKMTMDYVNISIPNILANVIEIVRPGKLTICEVQVLEGDCAIGRYGDECREYCHCKDEMSCNKFSGKCSSYGCNAGWIGVACNRECPFMFYGQSCEFRCGNCAGDTTCHSITGHCTSGCSNGYSGYYCKDPVTVNEEKTGLAVGLSAGLTGFVIIIGLFALYCWRTRICRERANAPNNHIPDWLENAPVA